MLTKENAILVVVDIQGKLATLMYEKDRLYTSVNRMIEGARVLDIPIIWTEQLPDKLGVTDPEISAHLSDMKPLVKKTFSCCGDPAFMDKIRSLNRRQILLTGIETHICVYQTAADLLKAGYEVYLVRDAVSSRIPDNYSLGVDRIKELGATLTSVEMSLFEMMKVAEGDQFKQVVKLLK
jgi:nicotinamidase-related amidase